MRKIFLLLMILIFCVFTAVVTGCGAKDEIVIDQAEDTPIAAEPSAEADIPETPAEVPEEESPAEETNSGTVEVFISIADAGTLVLNNEPLAVEDSDRDGMVTVDEVLLAAHAAFYRGGIKGYATEDLGKYGQCISRLWGVDNGGFYGFHVNDNLDFTGEEQLSDPVLPQDCVYAYSFQDLLTWSDIYSYIVGDIQTAEDGSCFYQGQLMTLERDEFQQQVRLPLSGAEILVNGEKSGVFTDESGCFVLPLSADGSYELSAQAADLILIPPVCRFDCTVG
ncbi:MAG: carboxypeptidase-like regulatory domain-containing protein [Oscillospiraceae bacterium]|nr:carboxypeptidase-like regulatory domain-containing protein [Oscillospiraceae bacterium]